MRVLHVDDDDDIREITQMALEAVGGMEVVQASSGAAALEKASAFQPDVFLLDVMMPDMDGFELLEYLKMHETWSSIPVIVLTAKVLSPSEKDLLVSQTQHVFTKGDLDQDNFLREVKRYLAPVSH